MNTMADGLVKLAAGLMKISFFVCMIVTRPAQALAQSFGGDGSSQILWRLDYATILDDWVNHILQTNDGNFVAAGFLNRDDTKSDWRSLISKFTLKGETLWTREHGIGGGVDAFWAVTEATNGQFAVGGFTTRIGRGGIDAYVAVLTSDGYMIKENAFGDSRYDRATDIAPATDGGFMLAGFTEGDSVRKRDILLIKVDASGIEQWRKTYGGPQNDQALYIEPVADGGFVLTGTTEHDRDGDVLFIKVDSNGNEIWRRDVGSDSGTDIPHSLQIYPDGRIQATGYTGSWGATINDMLSITLSASGEVLRVEIFGGPDDDRVMLSHIDSLGRNWLTGYTKSAGAGEWDIFITRLDSSGSFEGYVTTFGGPKNDNGTAILPLADGTLLIGAYSENIGFGRQDAFVMHITHPDWKTPHPQFLKKQIQ